MSVLTAYFNYDVDQRSPIVEDYIRVVNHDEKGNEYVTYEKFDSYAYQKMLGPVENWSLDNLMKAGIDPSFPIHTGYNTRIEGLNDVDIFATEAEKIINETKTKE